VHRAVMIFRREVGEKRGARPMPAPSLVAAPEPEILASEGRGERDGHDTRIRLSAERGAPLPPRANRPPADLG
jgi:hypothetical protein